MDDKTQSRKWLLTFNNPEKYDMGHDNIRAALSVIKDVTYWCMCDEVGEQGTYHTHLFIYRRNTMRFSMIKNRFPTAHIDYCRGTCQENRDYVRKEGKHKDTDKEQTNLPDTFEEFGECSVEKQGERSDLNQLYGMIKDGMTNFQILEERPGFMTRMNDIDLCRQIIREEEFKNKFRELQVEYWYGKPGVGKSSTIMKTYGFPNVYRITSYRYPFDGYHGQDVIVFEDFHDSLKIHDMLGYLDGYPLELPCRYHNKIACYTKVFITSNVAFEEQYRGIFREYPDTYAAFERRVSHIREFGSDGFIDYQSVDEYKSKRHMKILEKENPFTVKEKYEQEKLEL